jgi:hypothetical protein
MTPTNVYPLLVALVGFVAGTLLTQRALALLDTTQKAALVEASARTRLYTLAVVVIFVALIFWRPFAGWVFLGICYLVLGVRSIFRLRRLALPPEPTRLVLIGNFAAVIGIACCAFIYAERTLGALQ